MLKATLLPEYAGGTTDTNVMSAWLPLAARAQRRMSRVSSVSCTGSNPPKTMTLKFTSPLHLLMEPSAYRLRSYSKHGGPQAAVLFLQHRKSHWLLVTSSKSEWNLAKLHF